MHHVARGLQLQGDLAQKFSAWQVVGDAAGAAVAAAGARTSHSAAEQPGPVAVRNGANFGRHVRPYPNQDVRSVHRGEELSLPAPVILPPQ
ncbi:hypothetical protein CCHR01_17308 [Colletotrichum chrysophilum]|uniref:Uncharacterized protein n=1 Tax=Colletotrichum chrysophilum TaxID=1836956 RepID=A0AAD9A276_9PEZI|nr:hypothetical protein CCHR01_17308 [Colletotrichum chrysophilum]